MQPIEIAVIVLVVLFFVAIIANRIYRKVTHKPTSCCSECGGNCSGCSSCHYVPVKKVDNKDVVKDDTKVAMDVNKSESCCCSNETETKEESCCCNEDKQ